MNNFNNHLSVQTFNQVRVQTESLSIINTDSIIDLPESAYIQTNVLPNNYHAEVQTKSLWKLFKKSLKKIFCLNSSDITPQDVRVENMINNLEPSQDIPANNVISESNVQELVEASNSDSNILELAKVYDIMNDFDFGHAISQTNAIFDHYFIDGIHQYFIIYSDTFLSVNPDLINCFL
jgi:hypothetical protein